MGSSGICHRWPKNKAELETPCNLKWGRKNLLNWEPGDGGWNPPYWHLLTCDLGQLTASIDKGLSHPRGNSTIPHAVGKSLHYLSSIPWTSHCSLPPPTAVHTCEHLITLPLHRLFPPSGMPFPAHPLSVQTLPVKIKSTGFYKAGILLDPFSLK